MDRCDIVITGFRLNAVEKPTAALQRVLRVSEDEARALSKRVPCVVLGDVPAVAAQPLVAALREAGAHVQLREPGRSLPPETGGKTMPPQGFGEQQPVAPRVAGPVAMAPPAPSTPAAPDAYGLFNMTPASASAGPAARLSAYQLGEIEVVATKSQPAPAPTTKSQPAPAMTATKSQPAPAMTAIKSQPAPAMTATKSQPAPAMTATKSQPAPAMTATKSKPAPSPQMDMGALQMLSNGFRPTGEFGPALEIDMAALADRSARVQSTFQPNAGLESEPKRRGFFSTLLVPIVLFSSAAPHALALTGVAAASGAAVYMVRTSGQADPLADTRAHESDTEQASTTDDAAKPREGRGEATHPLLRSVPKAMEPSIAAILRSRIRGVSKISIEWPEGTKPDGFVECMLLDTAHSKNLKELESTGGRVDPPAEVQDQLADHIGTLQAANGTTRTEYVSICLAN